MGNKTAGEADKKFITDNIDGFELLGFIELDDKVREADLKGISAFDSAPQVVDEIKTIKDRLEEIRAKRN